MQHTVSGMEHSLSNAAVGTSGHSTLAPYFSVQKR